MAKKRDEKFKKKMREIALQRNLKGKNHPCYKDGRSLVTKYCIDCGKKLAN